VWALSPTAWFSGVDFLNWDDLAVSVVAFAVLLTMVGLLVSRDVTDRYPHVEVVGYSVLGRGQPFSWLLFTTPGSGLPVVLSVDLPALVLDLLIWLAVCLVVGLLIFFKRGDWYGP